MDMEKLSYEIFSILENKFLFGGGGGAEHQKPLQPQLQQMKSGKHATGKVRILSIDGGGSTDGLLAAHSLCLLESFLRRKSGDPKASISDFFDVAAGTGAGGILAALLFTRGKDGRALFTADRALDFLVKHRRKVLNAGLLRKVFRTPSAAEKLMRRTFGELTLKDTVKPLLIPCFDLSSRAPFVFSRADAMEMDCCDFSLKNVCVATAASSAMELRSVDGRRKIAAVDGGVAMNNPTAAAITHVLNNKQEFPFVNDVDDVVVLSLGNGEAAPSLVGIAGEAASDMVDQAVSMAFGRSRTTNYVRIQGFVAHETKMDGAKMVDVMEKLMGERNVESVLFKGKKMSESTNQEKLEMFASELVKEEERRKTSILPTVVLKHPATSPRTSSATSLSTLSSTTS